MSVRAVGVWLWIALIPGLAFAQSAAVNGVRVWAAPDNTRVVLDLSGPVAHSLFSLSKPERVVVDLKNARLSAMAGNLNHSAGLIRGIRSGKRNGKDLRLVLDLGHNVQPRSLLLKPNAEYGHRLVIDLLYKDKPNTKQPVKTAPTAAAGAPRELVVALDPGHGGEDPGARGRKGTREKDVVLSIARRLEKLVNKEPGMRAVLTRKGDYFISLRNRIRKAHEHKANLFVSIHADAFRNRRARGSSVYVLSNRGASSEMARILAKHENAADLVGGVSLNDKDDLLKTVLLDLSQTASLEESIEVGQDVLGELRGIGRVHKRHVQRAGFVVLKSPDIPSILVETAFISNPKEERQLRDTKHQQKLAHAMLKGIRSYFRNNPPPGTLMASREHVIKRGDTLSEIATKYDVSLKKLRGANSVKANRLRIGDVLRIPSGS